MIPELTVEAAVARARARNDQLRAILLPLYDRALERDRALAAEPPRSELHRVPYVLKDIWDTAGIRTTGGSWRHRERIPAQSSSIHQAFEDAGAVLIGKSNLPDLSLPPETDNHLVGRALNPLDPTRTPGGSSGGGAAAVADGMAELEWGSDFGGSIRMPAAFCGLWGMRLSSEVWPAHEHFPRLPPELRMLNGMGPITRSPARIRSILRTVGPTLRREGAPAFVVRGVAILDPGRWRASWPTFVQEMTAAAARAGLPVRTADGLPPPATIDTTYDGFICSNFDALLGTGELPLAEGLGAALHALTIGRIAGTIAGSRRAPAALRSMAEAAVDRRVHPMTAEILVAIALGRITLYSRPAKQAALREVIVSAARRLWDQGWLILAPTCTHPAPRHGKVFWRRGMMAFNKLGNLIDSTAVALPFGNYPDGLPRSLQLLGPPGSEDAVLDAAERFAAAR